MYNIILLLEVNLKCSFVARNEHDIINHENYNRIRLSYDTSPTDVIIMGPYILYVCKKLITALTRHTANLLY